MSKYDDLVAKLREIFQIDRPDLDFGVYRVLNARADEINDYLSTRLKERVAEALSAGSSAAAQSIKDALAKAEKGAEDAGIDPADSPKVKELRLQLTSVSTGAAEHENQVFSHLLTFFSRYYDKGDFISQRRYKGDTYAIPYSGEEVVLHWANRDQYYIKSGESFSNYSFKLDDGRNVHFRLVAADTAKDNRKDNDKERRFILAETRTVSRLDDDGEPYEETIDPVSVEDGELIIRFDYATAPKGTKQEKLVEDAVATVLADEAVKTSWLDLAKRAPTEKKTQRTLLEKHLTTYTQKYTADYFIHKELGPFLRRELDFYIKNEVMHLDDVQNAKAFAAIEKNLRMIQCLRAIARDLITFLASIEDFQKKLWLKRKFVVAAEYCVTLDRVPEALYPAIAANGAQWAQWHELGMRESAEAGSVDDLKTQQFLMVDTSLFDASFRAKLLRELPHLDASTEGLLIHGDNFQALTLMQERYREQVKCVYIDPPYNTGNDFLYKDAFRNSSWLTMLDNRFALSRQLTQRDGVFYVHIDDKDDDNRTSHRLMNMLEDRFGVKNYLDNLIWVKNTTHNDAKSFSHNHEYLLAFAVDREAASATHQMFRIAKPGFEEVQSLVADLNKSYPPLAEVQAELRALYSAQTAKFKKECEVLGLPWNKDTKRMDPWKGIKQYKFADYRDADFKWVDPVNAKEKQAKLWVFREGDPSWPNSSTLTAEHNDPNHPEYRFYNPQHDTNGKECGWPARGWLWRKTPNPEKPKTLSFDGLAAEHMIHFGDDENKIPQFKRFLENVGTDVVKSVITDFTDGEKEVSNLFGSRGNFPNPKPTPVTQKMVEISAKTGELVLDYFAGSGSTGHAILKANRNTGSDIRYSLIDVGVHFETILKPRMQKVVYSADWKDGKPTSPATGMGHAFKVLKIESYEDTLNNLTLARTAGQKGLLDNFKPEAKDDYLMRYMLDVESKSSLLSVDDFQKPFDYTLKIAVDSAGAFETRKVDLIETFSYLIGLRVGTVDLQMDKGYALVTGTLPSGERTMVVWRDCEVIGYEALTALFDSLGLVPGQEDYDLIYVNGDHNVPDVLVSKVEGVDVTERMALRRIEPVFLDAMFNVDDV